MKKEIEEHKCNGKINNEKLRMLKDEVLLRNSEEKDKKQEEEIIYVEIVVNKVILQTIVQNKK
jgi:hypothetical protein